MSNNVHVSNVKYIITLFMGYASNLFILPCDAFLNFYVTSMNNIRPNYSFTQLCQPTLKQNTNDKKYMTLRYIEFSQIKRALST